MTLCNTRRQHRKTTRKPLSNHNAPLTLGDGVGRRMIHSDSMWSPSPSATAPGRIDLTRRVVYRFVPRSRRGVASPSRSRPSLAARIWRQHRRAQRVDAGGVASVPPSNPAICCQTRASHYRPTSPVAGTPPVGVQARPVPAGTHTNMPRGGPSRAAVVRCRESGPA